MSATVSVERLAARKSKVRRASSLAVGVAARFPFGYVSPPGSYPDFNGLRNGDCVLVNPQTGVVLSGESEGGI
jgi:hypothetical protein